jgi:hypothetical protein
MSQAVMNIKIGHTRPLIKLAHVHTNGIYSVPTWGTYIGTGKLFETKKRRKQATLKHLLQTKTNLNSNN